jgi:hypothetical protein
MLLDEVFLVYEVTRNEVFVVVEELSESDGDY